MKCAASGVAFYANLRPLHGALDGCEVVRIDWNSSAAWPPSWGTASSCLGASSPIPRPPGRRFLRTLLRRPAFLAHLYHPSLGGGQSNPHQFAATGACADGLLGGALPSYLLHLALYHGCSPPADVFGLRPSQRRPSWSPLGYYAARKNGYAVPALLRSWGRPSPLHPAERKGSALPPTPSERGGPPPLLGLSPGLCGSDWSVAYFTHRTVPTSTRYPFRWGDFPC